MAIIELTQKEIRRLSLNRQGLLKPSFGKGKHGALAAIERLGYVQIDTISVVERAHHHVLFSRVNDYKNEMLDELLEKDKSVFEYWSHAAAYLPMKDYRYSLVKKETLAGGSTTWFQSDPKLQRFILDKIKAEGSVQAKDFEHKGAKKGGWWEWKPAKTALEHLFMKGELMVVKREGFRKVYDIPERVLPKGVDVSKPSPEEYFRHLVLSTIEALGLASLDDITHLRSAKVKTEVKKAIATLVEEKKVVAVKCKSIDDMYYSTETILQHDIGNPKKRCFILSPFDNSVIRRKRLEKLFGYDYTIECYVPEPKRKYGYFCLPLLYGTDFIGRMDCKTDRKNKIFTVKNVFSEVGISKSKCIEIIGNEVEKFAQWNGCDVVKW